MKCMFCDGNLSEVSRKEFMTPDAKKITIEILFKCDKCNRTPSMRLKFDGWYDEVENYITRW